MSSKAALTPTEKSSPSPRNPMDMMRSLTSEMDRWFTDLWAGRHTLPAWPAFREDIAWNPEIEVEQRAGKLVVRADLPGMTKDNVKVDVTDNVLTIEGERRSAEEKREEGYYRSERSYGRFCRNIALPEGAKPDSATATFKDGVLEVTLDVPAQSAPEPRHVAIN